jgi:hypothetical protein
VQDQVVDRRRCGIQIATERWRVDRLQILTGECMTQWGSVLGILFYYSAFGFGKQRIVYGTPPMCAMMCDV